jgi:hypothetical protein
VIDDGIGIPPDKQDKVFEPFQRAGQETGPIEGTGIGLTITKRLAEMMKGRVGFTSEVDRGSQFWVEIPVHRRAIGEQLPVAVAKGPAGFYRYLTKPVKVAELTSVLELLVRAKPAT